MECLTLSGRSRELHPTGATRHHTKRGEVPPDRPTMQGVQAALPLSPHRPRDTVRTGLRASTAYSA